MLKSRLRSPASSVLKSWSGALAVLLWCVAISAFEMPFSSDTLIDGSFDGASSVISVDLDCDGDLDVAATSRWGGTVSWWENPGWSEHAVATGFSEAYDLAVGDFDGDGYPDLVGAARTASGSNVRWWANPGPGAVGLWDETNVSSALLSQALSVDAGDIDQDGTVDIAVAGYHSSVGGVYMWFRNDDGDGASFIGYDVGTGYSTPHSVDIADVNDDQHFDLIGANYGDDTVVWFENDGSIISSDPWPEWTIRTGVDGAICVRSSDIDQDGDLDVAAAAYEAGRLLWFENSGADPPLWENHVVEWALDGAYSVDPVDLDRDGDLDLVGSGRVDDAVRWWEQVGSSWYERPIDDDIDGARSAVAADFDEDGDYDVVAAADGADDVALWENRSVHRDARFWTPTAVSNNSGEYWAVDTLDANVDGKMDIVAVASNEGDYGDVMLFLQGATSGSWTTVELADNLSGAKSIRVADLNDDMFLDLLVAASGANEIVMFVGGGTDFFYQTTITSAFDGAADAEAVDIDGDGDMDVVGAAETAGLLRWWGGSPYSQHEIASLPGVSAVAAGDLDGDFDPDIAAVSASDGKLVLYENLGETGGTWTWNSRPLTTALSQPRTVVVADISGDGRNDIVVASSTSTADLVFYRNLGGSPPTLSQSTIPGPMTAVSGVSDLHAVDLDLDGDLDLTGVLPVDEMAYAWENVNGMGTSWNGFPIQHFMGTMMPLAVTSADIDADGDPDPVIAGNNDIAMVCNRGGQFDMVVAAEPDEEVGEGEMVVLMTITPRHLGRSTDTALELEWINLDFEREDGSPMEEAELNALIDRLYLFHDDNDNGILEVGVDPLLVVDSTITMVYPGYVQLAVPHGQMNPSIVTTASETFLLVAEIEEGAASATPSCFRTEHKAGGTVTALRYEIYEMDPYPALFFSVDGGLVCVRSFIFNDGFESGDTSAWSVTH